MIKSDLLIITLGRLLQIAISLVALRLSTTLLSHEEMGKVYFAIAWYTFFVVFLISPAGHYVNRNTHRWYADGVVVEKIFNQLAYIFFVGLLFLCFAFFVRLVGFYDGTVSFLVVVFLLVVVTSFNQTVIPLLNMLGERKVFVFLNMVTALLSVAFSFVFMVSIKDDSLSWLFGIVLGNFLAFVAAVAYFNNKFGEGGFTILSRIDFSQVDKVLSFMLPISIATLFMWAQNSGYRLLIENYYGLAYLGFIGVGLAVSAQIFAVVESLVTQYLHPIVYKKLESVDKVQRNHAVNEYVSISIPIYFSIAIMLTFSVEGIFPLLVDKQYFSGLSFAIYGVWIEFGRVTSNVLSLVSHSEKKTKLFILPYVAGSIFLNVLLFFVATVFDMKNAIPIVLVASSFITMLIMYFLMNKLLYIIIPVGRLLLVSVFCAPCVVYFMLFDFPFEIGYSYVFMLSIGGVLYLMGMFVFLYMNKFNDG